MNCRGKVTEPAWSSARVYSFQVLPALVVMAVLAWLVVPRVPSVVVWAMARPVAPTASSAAAMPRSAKVEEEVMCLSP